MKLLMAFLGLVLSSNFALAASQSYSCGNPGDRHTVSLGADSLQLDGKGTYKEVPSDPALDPFHAYEQFHMDGAQPSDLLVWRTGDGVLILFSIHGSDGDHDVGNCSYSQ